MNLYYILGYIRPITWQTVAAAYVSSFFFDLSHGVCTFLVLWARLPRRGAGNSSV